MAPVRTYAIAVFPHRRRVLAQHEDLVAIAIEFLRQEFAELELAGNCPEEITHFRSAFAQAERRVILFTASRVPFDIRCAGLDDRLNIAARKSGIHALHEGDIRLAHQILPVNPPLSLPQIRYLFCPVGRSFVAGVAVISRRDLPWRGDHVRQSITPQLSCIRYIVRGRRIACPAWRPRRCANRCSLRRSRSCPPSHKQAHSSEEWCRAYARSAGWRFSAGRHPDRGRQNPRNPSQSRRIGCSYRR